MRVLVMADTHVPNVASNGDGLLPLQRLPHQLRNELRRADLILHAGDVTGEDFLDAIGTFAPVHAVLGNNDRDLVGALPESIELELEGVPLAMVHDSGPRTGRASRLRRLFPTAGVVVYGHSHLAEDRLGECGQRLFNPGSPTQRRSSPLRSFGLLHVRSGRVTGHRIVAVPAADS